MERGVHSIWPRGLGLMLLFACLIGCTERRQESWIGEADELTAKGQYRQAFEKLQKTIGLNSNTKQALRATYKLGFIAETYLKDFETALQNYVEFQNKSVDPVSVYEVQKRIANIYFEHGADSMKAVDAYKKLIELNPDSLEVDFFQFRLAQSSFRMNDFEKARSEYQALLEKSPRSQYAVRAKFEIGNTYYMQAKYSIAFEAWKQFLRQNPQSDFSAEAEFLMAQCLEQEDKLTAALQMYEAVKGRYSSPEVLSVRIESVQRRLAREKK